ncbi:hypothetical protein PR001_g19093 [Phytophthora rubi]|uniref:Uncharacterized protein n=1 Tax=Phytophthora rubi TaxID=129364 RepID=A0A6A3K4V6_9STRA|nr:hypothetical protein PR001_g19093 [Phytophthora rubi]
MSPKTVKAVARARALEASMFRRDDPPAAAPEPQVITNAGVDEGVPPELLQPENRQHLADRSHQEASQAVGTKRDRETHAPRTQDQLLALRYWTRDEYREHLRQRRMPGPGAPQCDMCPVVLLVDTGLTRQRNETEFEGVVFRMPKMIADDTWSDRFFDRHKPIPGVILEEVLQKIQKSWQLQPTEPKSLSAPTRSVGMLKSGHEVLVLPATPAALQYPLDMVVEDALITKQKQWSPQREWCRIRTLSAARLALALTRRAFWLLLSPVSDC